MSFAYIDIIKKLIEKVEAEEKGVIEQVAELFADTLIQKKAIYVFGASHAGIITQEMYYRAGGLMPINPIFGRELSLDAQPITNTSLMERLSGYGTILARQAEFQPGDVLLVHSVSGRNAVAIDLALAAKEQGATLVCITNMKYTQSTTSKHSSGKRLFEVCDYVIDNHGDIGDATCAVGELNQKVGPSSTVIGAMIANTIVVETVRKMVERGVKAPPIFYSANMDGGDELNRKIQQEYQDVIRYRL